MEYLYKDHELNVDLWQSKRSLFEAFYGAFYDFILTKKGGKEDLESHNIHSKEDFYAYADFYADGRDSCYAMGFGFYQYFSETMMDGSLDKLTDSCFIGYCHKNGLFTDFINFLISFFAYWRNDEGCTKMDPYNYADNFFISSWAILVDTSKLFYFSSETVYWWQSFRVKYVLDHIPGTFLSELPKEGLPEIKVAGYKFEGWYDSDKEDAKLVTDPSKCNKVYAHLTRRDVYNYWEKEEKKIKKVYVKDWKRCDPV